MATTLLFLCLSMPAWSELREPESPPNVLLIAVDDQNDWVGALGGHPQAKTPRIDEFASRGTLFSNAHCQSPVCNPSRASLLAGRYPHATGIYFLSPPYDDAPALRSVDTMPERFADEGYRVMGVGKIFHGTGNQVFQRIGEYGGSLGGFGPRPKEKINVPHGHPLWDWGEFPDTDDQMPDHRVADWAIERLRQPSDTPFFLAVGFYRPHVPMYVPEEWFRRHPLDQVLPPTVLQNDVSDLPRYALDLTTLRHVAPTHDWILEADQWQKAVQAYLASSSFVDHQVGRVIDALNQSPHRDDTIIALFSDHGFHLGEKERWAKRSLWEDSTRVPLIIVDPSRPGGHRSNKPAELIDVFPTLLELTGLAADAKQDGQSLVPLMSDPGLTSWNHPALTSFGPGNMAVRTDRYRYIRYNDGSEELYDHENDPHEWHNLVQSNLGGPTPELPPPVARVLERHRAYVPTQQHPGLHGNSTGHDAYSAAEASRRENTAKPMPDEKKGPPR